MRRDMLQSEDARRSSFGAAKLEAAWSVEYKASPMVYFR